MPKKKLKVQDPVHRDPKPIMEQFALMRETSLRNSILYDAQKLQLDYWVRIVVPHAVDHTIVFQDEPEVFNRSLTYDVQVKGKGPDAKEMVKRLEHLDGWVKWLLGVDVTLRVKLDGHLFAEFGKK